MKQGELSTNNNQNMAVFISDNERPNITVRHEIGFYIRGDKEYSENRACFYTPTGHYKGFLPIDISKGIDHALKAALIRVKTVNGIPIIPIK